MENNKKFTELLNAYLSGQASPKMHMSLMRLIKTGDYDDLLKTKIEEELYQFDKGNVENENSIRQLLSNTLTVEMQPDNFITTDKKNITPWWKWAAAASVILLLSVLSWFLIDKNRGIKQTAQKTDIVQKLVADSQGKKYIRLQDGSTVLLNEGSKLEYPDNFGSSVREVTLIGEGYFDIQHDARRPFIVHTGKVKTTVLGTAFNIKAYPDQKEITVTVTRGKVKVSDDTKTLGTITSNESIAVNTENKLYRQEKVNAENAVEWKKQYLVLDNISLGDAAVLIDARYHVTISFSKDELKDCRISVTFLDNESLEQVLTVVAGVINGRYSSQPNDQVIISGEGCN